MFLSSGVYIFIPVKRKDSVPWRIEQHGEELHFSVEFKLCILAGNVPEMIPPISRASSVNFFSSSVPQHQSRAQEDRVNQKATRKKKKRVAYRRETESGAAHSMGVVID